MWKFLKMTSNSIEFLIWAHARTHTHPKCAFIYKIPFELVVHYLSCLFPIPFRLMPYFLRFVFHHFYFLRYELQWPMEQAIGIYTQIANEANSNKYKNLNIAFAVDWVDCRFEFKSISVYNWCREVRIENTNNYRAEEENIWKRMQSFGK